MTNKQNPSEPAWEEDATRLIIGAEQQVGAGEEVEAVGRPGEQSVPVAAGADPDQEIPSATEAEDRGGPEQRLKDDEEAAELDDALDDSFPASDPPSQTSKGRIK